MVTAKELREEIGRTLLEARIERIGGQAAGVTREQVDDAVRVYRKALEHAKAERRNLHSFKGDNTEIVEVSSVDRLDAIAAEALGEKGGEG